MICAKYQPETAVGWLSAREIRKRGYFDGEVKPRLICWPIPVATSLAHLFATGSKVQAPLWLSATIAIFTTILDAVAITGGAAQSARAFFQKQAGRAREPKPAGGSILTAIHRRTPSVAATSGQGG